jgi:hypothetical protein
MCFLAHLYPKNDYCITNNEEGLKRFEAFGDESEEGVC